MTIRQLNETIINQIAAGEVVERPASVVKELVENAIDAHASHIDVVTADGGKTLIRVTDNGTGIPADELVLAVSRHCTSKLTDNVHDIRALGFRGEALPSIGSVARLALKSRIADAESGFEITVHGGRMDGPRPTALNRGTIVDVRDLFFAIPARLKFMKTDRAEAAAITDVIKRIAIAFPHIRFSLVGHDRMSLEIPATASGREGVLERISQILGKEFPENTIALDAEHHNVRLAGFAGIPSFSRANSLHQFAYINGRPVRDKQIWSAIRSAYSDVIARDRYPVAVLFLTLDPTFVDVNVHPAKADVRFRDPGLVRGLIVGAIRQALSQSGMKTSTGGATAMLQSFRVNNVQSYNTENALIPNLRPTNNHESFPRRSGSKHSPIMAHPVHHPLNLDVSAMNVQGKAQKSMANLSTSVIDAHAGMEEVLAEFLTAPLGAACAQIHSNYIIAQTEDSLIIVDQHAAHERLVYEALKIALHSRPLPTQMLLIPEIVDLPEEDIERLVHHADMLARFGLSVERFGTGAIMVRETPSMLGEMDIPQLIRDLADEISEHDTCNGLEIILHRIAATMACHGSVRSGRCLKREEMNALLRQMEATPDSGTCNHGRPTYIELKLTDIERLFGRK